MTVREVWHAVLRRWYAVLAVVAIMAGVAAAFVGGSGLYTTRTVVSLSLPARAEPLEQGGSREAGIIAFAAAIAREINGGREPTRYASADAPLYGAGIRQDVVVGLPDTGGQWGVFYSRADIELQIVGPTQAWVEERQQELIRRVQEIAAAQQDTVDVPSDQRIVTAVEPLTLKIDHIAPTRTTRTAAFAALLVVTLLLGSSAAVVWERLAQRTAHRRRARAMSSVAAGEAS